ncbi:MAG: tetratricopeptide repeat protein [Lautropia sp.]
MNETIRQLREQLRSVEALHASQTLDDAAYRHAVASLERKLVDAVVAGPDAAADATGATGAQRVSLGRVAALMLAAAIAGGAIHHLASRPATADPVRAREVAGVSRDLLASLEDFTGRKAGTGGASGAPHPMGSEQIAAMVEGLSKRLARQPDDADGWQMLARSYGVLGRGDDALAAYRKAVALRGDDAVLLADYADALALAQDRRIEGEPLEIAKKALALDPNQPKALSLVATADFDRGDYEKAATLWDTLLRTAPADSPLREPAKASMALARERATAPVAGVAGGSSLQR